MLRRPGDPPRRGQVKYAEEIMEILEGFDRTGRCAMPPNWPGVAEHGGPVMWPIGRLGHWFPVGRRVDRAGSMSS